MKISIPELSVVVLIGTSGSGKSTFSAKHFLPSEILSSDYCRYLVSDDENDQSVSKQAFEVLHYIMSKRLALGKLTVIDATNVQAGARSPLIEIARKYHCIPVAIVFDVPEKVCQERNNNRPDRNFGPHVIRHQRSQLRKSFKALKREGFRQIHKLTSVEEIDEIEIERTKLWTNKTELKGPFDIIGDVHGCYDELVLLLEKLGYTRGHDTADQAITGPVYSHPEGRQAIFLGDFVDRGPKILDTIRLVYNMVTTGNALSVPGNHETKLLKALRGKNVQITHGLDKTLAELEQIPEEEKENFNKTLIDFLHSLTSHYVLDNKKLVVAHAGVKEEMQGRGSAKAREFCLYGETTGEIDEFGLPVRYHWAEDYRGNTMVVYGHTPIPEPEWLNRTINIDTGCVFGGRLTALRYPEKVLETVEAANIYCKPLKPLVTNENKEAGITSQQKYDDLLNIEDVLGKKIVNTRLRSNITIREENAAPALEIMSRFAVNPKWLIYLPPTMSPSETSKKDEYLEYPDEAFSYFRSEGVPAVLCEQKHMGSRAVIVICKNEEAVLTHFGIKNEGIGTIYTRTGRKFFKETEIEQQLLARLQKALDKGDFWNSFNTEWFCFDCEIMPWSEKAGDLLKNQYAPVGSAGFTTSSQMISALEQTIKRGGLEKGFSFQEGSSSQELEIEPLLENMKNRQAMISSYIDAYRQYCWTVSNISDIKIAPFHILAVENRVLTGENHIWHMDKIAEICKHDEQILLATPYKVVDLSDESSMKAGCDWWLELTGQGGEGMVIKPYNFIEKGKRGLIQPALKCRGREYLRIIYGPEYTAKENIDRLRSRGLYTKRSLALREFALGIEALERFVRKEPLIRVHECVFGVLAMECEPVDPRL